MIALGLNCGMWTLSCCTWDLVPWPGIKPRPPALGAWSLSHRPPGRSPESFLYSHLTDGLFFFFFFKELHIPLPFSSDIWILNILGIMPFSSKTLLPVLWLHFNSSYEWGNSDQSEKREFQKHCSQGLEAWAGVNNIEKKEGRAPRSMSWWVWAFYVNKTCAFQINEL